MQAEGRPSLGAASLRVLTFLILTALAATIVVVQQRGSGAYVAEFSATDPAEATHVLAGMRVADWIAAGLPAPGRFFADHALRLPAPGLAAGAALHPLAQGLWIAALGPGTPAVLLLPAFLAALLAVGAGWVASRATGPLPGIAVGAVLMAAVPLRAAAITVGLDLPLALLALGAALAVAGFLAAGQMRFMLLYAAAAIAAVLTAPQGAALLGLPFLALALGGRPGLLLRRAFWLPLLPIALLAGLWLLVFPAARGLAAPTLDQAQAALLAAAAALRAGLGDAFLVLAAVGALAAVVNAWRGIPAARPMAAVTALAACLLAGLALSGAPVDPVRALPLAAPAAILSAYGAISLLRLLSTGWDTVFGLAVALVLLLAAMPALLEPVRKRAIGMDEVAEAVIAKKQDLPVVLVAASPGGEGALIAATAQRDRARTAFVVPLARRAAGATPDALMADIAALGASFLVIEATPGARALPAVQSTILAAEAAVAAHPDRFRLVGTYPRADGGGEARLYAVSGAPRPDAATLRQRLAAGAGG